MLVEVSREDPHRTPLAKTQQEIPDPGTGLGHKLHPSHQVGHLAELFVEEVDGQVETIEESVVEILDRGDVGVTAGRGSSDLNEGIRHTRVRRDHEHRVLVNPAADDAEYVLDGFGGS